MLRATTLCALTLFALGSLSAKTAAAQTLLKPNGGNAAPLRMKIMKAAVRIDGAFATTDLDLTFQNEESRRVEADFLSAVPPGAVVTDFAYYYGDERVPARVAEKERAAAIYRAITSRMRDPALVELIGKNLFRARIFPVMPNADLRVRIRMVQALTADRSGWVYSLPLRTEEPAKNALDLIDLSAEVRPGDGVSGVSNSLGLPVTKRDGVYRLAFAASNYRPQRDLRIVLSRRAEPIATALFAARSGGRDGFFALSLTPNRTLSHPTVRISGVRTYDLVPFSSGGAGPTRPLVVCGRYRGSGNATVLLQGTSAGGPVSLRSDATFTDRREPNNLACKLWASAEIAHLGESPRNRARIVALSMRHALPSHWTSWIAIPKEERERYRQEQARAEFDLAAGKLAGEIEAGRGRSPYARSLRARLNALAKKTGETVRDALRERLSDRMRDLARRIAEGEERGSVAALNREMARLSRETGLSPAPYLKDARRWRDMADYRVAAERLAQEIGAGREETAEGRRLRRRLEALGRSTGTNAAETLASYLNSELINAARQLARARRRPSPDPRKIAEMEAKLSRLGEETGKRTDVVLRRQEVQTAGEDAYQAADELSREIAGGRGDGERAAALRREIDRLASIARSDKQAAADFAREIDDRAEAQASQELMPALAREIVAGRGEEAPAKRDLRLLERIAQRAGRDPAQDLRNGLMDGDAYQSLAREWVGQKERTHPDDARIAELERGMTRLERAAGVSDDSYRTKAEQQYAAYPADEEGIRIDLIAELRKKSPDPAKVHELEERLKALNLKDLDSRYTANRQRPGYADDRVARLATEVEIGLLERRIPAEPGLKERLAALEAKREELRARMGDPMISVDAPADALRVVALMPDGEIKPLTFDAKSRRWVARFDIPGYAKEGTYVVTVVVVAKDGSRRSLTIRYHVDVTPPSGAGRARVVDANGKPVLRLEIEASEDTARVAAMIPGSDPVDLKPSPGAPGRFFALVPLSDAEPTGLVTFVLTDRAHNRAAVTIDPVDR
jgi:hypothetical protein